MDFDTVLTQVFGVCTDILPEACAVAREAGWRTGKMRHFDIGVLVDMAGILGAERD